MLNYYSSLRFPKATTHGCMIVVLLKLYLWYFWAINVGFLLKSLYCIIHNLLCLLTYLVFPLPLYLYLLSLESLWTTWTWKFKAAHFIALKEKENTSEDFIMNYMLSVPPLQGYLGAVGQSGPRYIYKEDHQV